MMDIPSWIRPGLTGTLIWYDGVGEASDHQRLYQVSGPVLEAPPTSPHFLLVPVGQSDFAARLYRSEVSLSDLRVFLESCELTEGRLTEEMDFVAARRLTPVLAVLDAWGESAAGDTLAYHDDIGAFLAGDSPLFVSAEAYARLQREPDRFGTAWVCEECGEAADAAVFLWTTHRETTVQVRLVIENAGGVWTVRLHPFEIRKEGSKHG